MPLTVRSVSTGSIDPLQIRRALRVVPGGARRVLRATRLDLVTTRAGFDALEEDWNALFERAGRNIHLFQTFNWHWHWANHFLGDGGPQLAIVAAYDGDTLVMVWPLVLERVGPLKRLRWMGDPVSQYGDVLVDDGDADSLLRASWAFVALRTGASVFHLRKVRQDSNIAPWLAANGARATSEVLAPYLDLSSAASFAAYETRYSGNVRRNRKRQRRRLEERGATVLSWHTEGPLGDALTATAFGLKRLWLKRRGIVSPSLIDPRTARFFADVTHAATRPAGCHVISLSCGDRAAALEIGVRCKDRTAIHVITYDPDFGKVGAGSLLMEDSVRRAFEDGMTVFDLLAPDDGYKREWADDAVVVRDWAAPLSMLGRAYASLYLGLFEAIVKRGVDALPVGVRRVVAGMLGQRRGADA